MIAIDVLLDQPGITLDRVRFGFGTQPLLSNISWELGQGQCAAITGPSGSGKSTFLLIAAGLLPPHHGTVLLGGHPLKRLAPSERVHRKLRCGFVFQDGGLFANMDTFSNVSLPLYYHRDILNLDEQAITERCEEALELVQIDKRHWQTIPAHLSFGDRKRLALARALAIEPNYFFFDDPDIGMDPSTAMVTHKVLSQLRDSSEVTLVVATNRNKLLERLEIDSFRLEHGELCKGAPRNIAPSGWSLPPRIVIT